ncbi:hypothetical protein OHA40_07055 [Nocardia sp. NBC_00508]|uniref:hypothetical protein n=1 Tax=Nocardia sp. NBC_00508 TaxID=2975992 RepID=UPI002E81FA66|nr:hypothetical protein [Nocardia sp. NBC_00508]WUD67878.1 hypothetical protein OHA40_07055 [Nocardia sp. NBC_00508]
MSLNTAARVCAIPISLWLITALTADADYRANNIFAAPDFTFSLVLLIAAFLPWRLASPALTAGFFFGSGVITVAAINRFDHGEATQGITNLIIAAVYLTVALLLVLRVERTPSPAPQG